MTAVIAFTRILVDYLPVCAHAVATRRTHLQPRQLVHAEVRCEVIFDRGEIGALFRKTNKDEPLHDTNARRMQPEFTRLEALRHTEGLHQRSVKPVSPLMVRADEALDV